MPDIKFDAVVIGAGPGGYPAAIRLGQLKVKTAIIEREYIGGVCLNVGCIPSKSVIHAAKIFDKLSHSEDIGISIAGKPTLDMKKMQAWKGGVVTKLTTGVRTLLKGNGVEIIEGTAKLEKAGPDGHRITVGDKTIIAKNVVIATGSRPIEIPGFKIDQDRVIDSTGALALDHVPQRMVVIGGGYIGLELGMVYAKFGTKVTVVEALPSILAAMDKDCVAVVARKLKKMGVEVMTETKAKSWELKGDRAVLTVELKDGKTATIDTDKILLSIGRRPNSENLGLDALGVKTERGFITVDDKLRTNVAGIYAIGDVVGGMMLAHKATKEGEVVAEVIAGHKAAFDVRTIPAVVFTDPEIAATGMTEDEAKAKGHTLKIGKFPFAALGRALSVNDTDGFVKVIGDAKTGEVLGVHIVGGGASDLISEAALAIEMGAVVEDLRLTIHPHPTLSEAVMEAASVAMGDAIHVIEPVMRVVDLGVRPYREVWAEQLRLVAARQTGEVGDTLLVVEHPHVFTLGRRREAHQNVVAPGEVEVIEIERGGDVTYHGPGQLVAYPILQLEVGERDLHAYLRNLEEAAIRTCARFGVAAGREPGKTGAWSGGKKLCSIGIACRKWVTFHGLALNVTTDLAYFARINPCGFEASVMTSLAQLVPGTTVEAVRPVLVAELAATLARDVADHAA